MNVNQFSTDGRGRIFIRDDDGNCTTLLVVDSYILDLQDHGDEIEVKFSDFKYLNIQLPTDTRMTEMQALIAKSGHLFELIDTELKTLKRDLDLVSDVAVQLIDQIEYLTRRAEMASALRIYLSKDEIDVEETT